MSQVGRALAVTGFQQITSLSTSTSFTVPTAILGSDFAYVTCEGQAVRWRDDGTDPTASIGHRLAVNGVLEYDGPLTEIEFIEEASGAILNISYYKYI